VLPSEEDVCFTIEVLNDGYQILMKCAKDLRTFFPPQGTDSTGTGIGLAWPGADAVCTRNARVGGGEGWDECF